ncbi:hypothetical protein B0H99_103300 [Planomicrobium soli]|uniref:Uncharacterized protein n=1 Tax=Planomicrobium soli TaxID=1176648 RepID=A0A2P8H4M9_9BACL|nr:hypothetical protein B0H99_103300 [Planomicrobium soli]
MTYRTSECYIYESYEDKALDFMTSSALKV